MSANLISALPQAAAAATLEPPQTSVTSRPSPFLLLSVQLGISALTAEHVGDTLRHGQWIISGDLLTVLCSIVHLVHSHQAVPSLRTRIGKLS